MQSDRTQQKLTVIDRACHLDRRNLDHVWHSHHCYSMVIIAYDHSDLISVSREAYRVIDARACSKVTRPIARQGP